MRMAPAGASDQDPAQQIKADPASQSSEGGCAQAPESSFECRLTAGATTTKPSGRLQAVCQVCEASLAHSKEYYMRYRICETCRRMDQMIRSDGEVQRFCQQCGRFHHISAFDDNKRSCRARLERHNQRRRRRPASETQPPKRPSGSTSHTGDMAFNSTDGCWAGAQQHRQAHNLAGVPARYGCVEFEGWEQGPAPTQGLLPPQTLLQHQADQNHGFGLLAPMGPTMHALTHSGAACIAGGQAFTTPFNIMHRDVAAFEAQQYMGAGMQSLSAPCNIVHGTALSDSGSRMSDSSARFDLLSQQSGLLSQQAGLAPPRLLATTTVFPDARLQGVLSGSATYTGGLPTLTGAAGDAAADARARRKTLSWPLAQMRVGADVTPERSSGQIAGGGTSGIGCFGVQYHSISGGEAVTLAHSAASPPFFIPYSGTAAAPASSRLSLGSGSGASVPPQQDEVRGLGANQTLDAILENIMLVDEQD